MVRTSKSILAGTLAAAVALCAMPVRASKSTDDAAQAASASTRAVQAFDAGDYDTAIELFERAYAEDPQPNYLYNIARVYEEKGDFAAAIERYQRFVGEPRVDLEARENAITRLKVLREALEQVTEEPQAEPEPEPASEPAEVASPEARWAEQRELDTTPRERIRRARIAGYSLMGVGGAALVVGGVFGGLAVAKSRDADEAQFVDAAMGLREEARTRARVADAMLVSGGILAGAGLVVVLATLGKRHRESRGSHTAWVPTAGRGGLGLVVSHRF
jgi:tetratricopeptide (TPR) repeat protein